MRGSLKYQSISERSIKKQSVAAVIKVASIKLGIAIVTRRHAGAYVETSDNAHIGKARHQ